MGILVGICGGIAAYKMPQLCRLLIQQNEPVRTVLTKSAHDFVTPLTLKAITQAPVFTDMSSDVYPNHMDHIELARWAKMILIAPASAHVLAALAQGLAHDLLTTLCLATTAPIFCAPGMNEKMWSHPATQHNVAILKSRGVTFLGPDFGEQACGDVGWGRMQSPEDIVATLLARKEKLKGRKVLLTAGPTQEPIDPVRYITNASSGKMGYALAKAAYDLGADVLLVSGPTALPCPTGITRINVRTTDEMFQAVSSHIQDTDIFISAAACADFRPVEVKTQKMKKTEGVPHVTFTPTVDILAAFATRCPLSVGFAAETHDVEAYALKKLTSKRCDMIIANDVSSKEIGFESDDNEVTVFTMTKKIHFAQQAKTQLAYQLMELIGAHYDEKYQIENARCPVGA